MPTPLIVVMRQGQLQTVRELLKNQRVDVNATDDKGSTALIVASEIGEVKIARKLVKHDLVNVNAKHGNG